jgi:antitoxin CptB
MAWRIGMGNDDAGEALDVRLRRLRMRSWRRGIREMDLLLGGFSDVHLAALSPSELDAYETMLDENDHDLYAWVSKGTPAPEVHEGVLALIRRHHGVG